MSDSEEGNNINNTSNISFDSQVRGYSRRHSYYDNAFNMDFEYSYLDLMSNFGTFVSRTHEMYSSMETCISSMIEVQNERRISVNRRRERARNNRRVHEQQHLVADNDDSHDSHDVSNDASNDDGVVDNSGNEIRTNHTRQERDAREMREMNNNSRTTTGAGTGAGTGTGTGTGTGVGTGAGTTRRPLFDIGSVIYSIPRTVLLNTNTNTNTEPASLNRRRRRSGGLTISEIEENTEIMTYGSIPSNYILNTECPITRETFTPESVVLTLKQCKHCFVPFRMMTWLETHSTCPLCRANVIRVETPETNTATSNNETATNNNENDTNTETNTTNNSDNVNISNIFNNLLQNGNNDFNNLSIDNVNDNSIMFSFDLPSGQLNGQNSENNPFIIPQIERLMANTISRNIFNNGTSTYGVTPSTSNNNDNNNGHDNGDDNDNEPYPELD